VVAHKVLRPATFKVTASFSHKESHVQGTRPSKTALHASRAEKKGLVKDFSLEHYAPSTTEEQRWGYVIANAKFMLDDEEHLAELLRERRRMFTEKEREMNFYIVPEPAWIEALPADVKARLGRPAAAVMSTDLTWINFLKLRLDKVYKGEMDAKMKDSLASGGAESVGKFGGPRGGTWNAPYTKYSEGWWKVFLPEKN